MNLSTGRSPFEVVTAVKLWLPINLIPLPIQQRPSEDAGDFAKHMKDVHDEVNKQIAAGNESYKQHAKSQQRNVKFKWHGNAQDESRVVPNRYL